MDREGLEHIIRAAAHVSGEDDIVVVGSQAILAEHPDAPGQLRLSPEADVYPRADPSLADAIDGALGEGSMFHDTYDYYAHGVAPETARLPKGWQERLVPIANANTRVRTTTGKTRQATGWCLETHDLVLSRIAAGRPKDYEYAIAAIHAALVKPDALRQRARDMPLAAEDLGELNRRLEGLIARARGGPSPSDGDSGRVVH